MGLYVAYGLVVMHVSLGAMQFNHTPFLPADAGGRICDGQRRCIGGASPEDLSFRFRIVVESRGSLKRALFAMLEGAR
jgi:hypothetical protein